MADRDRGGDTSSGVAVFRTGGCIWHNVLLNPDARGPLTRAFVSRAVPRRAPHAHREGSLTPT